MRHQESELLITILFFVAVLFWAHRSNKGGKKFDPKNYGHGSGQFFDNGSYVGNIRSIVVFFLAIYIGGHIDEIGRWIWHQFGEELIVSPGKEAWHRVVARTIGIAGIVVSLINMQSIYAKSKKNALPPPQPEEPSPPSQTDTTESTGSSINSAHDEFTDRKK